MGNRYFFGLAFLVTGFILLTAKDDVELQSKGHAVIERGIKASDLLDPTSAPFVLRGSSMRKGEKQDFTFYWAPPNFRTETAASPGPSEYIVGNANNFWEKERTQIGFDLMESTMEVVDVVSPLRAASQEKVTRLRDKKDKGASLQCVTTESKEIRERESCFDPQTGVLISMKLTMEVRSPFGGPLPTYVPRFRQMTVSYKEFEMFGNKLYPGVVEYSYQGAVTMRRRIESLKALETPDAQLFVHDENAVRWDWCTGMSLPALHVEVTSLDDPARNVKTGKVKLVISENGKYLSGTVLQEKNPGDGTKLLEHYSRQEYVPARCGEKPVRGRTLVNYRQF